MTTSYKVRFLYIANPKTRECAFSDPVDIAGPEAEDIDRRIVPEGTVRAEILGGQGKLVRKVFFMGVAQTPEEISHMGGNAPYAVFVPELNRMFPAGKDDRIAKENGGFSSVRIETADDEDEALNADFDEAVKPAAKPKFVPRPSDYVEPGLQIIPTPPEPAKPRYIPGITDRKPY